MANIDSLGVMQRLKIILFMTKKILIIVILFCNGELFGQVKDTTDKKQAQTIIVKKPVNKASEERKEEKTIDWEMVSAIAQIIGTSAVLITLFFLFQQMKTANETNMLNSFEHIRDSINSFNDTLSQSQSDDLPKIITRGRQSYHGLSEEEKIRFAHVYGRLLNIIEAWYLLETKLSGEFKNSDIIYEVVRYYCSFKGVLEFWDECKLMYIAEVDEIIKRHTIITTENIKTENVALSNPSVPSD